MKYNTTVFPESPILAEVCGFYIAEFEDVENDGTAMTYDKSEFDAYRKKAICIADSLTGWTFTTETDCRGVYLTTRD